jgi:GPH family glycoside/pentoside/hexuronide:cation symporter
LLTASNASRLPFRLLLAYGLPALPAAALGLPLVLYLPTFYAIDLGLGFGVVGGVLVIARLWDVVTDPLVGWASDRFAVGAARRKPWLLASLPLVLVSVWFLFRPAGAVSATYLLIGAFAVYLGWTMMTIVHQAWGAELSGHYAERSRVMAAREMAGLGGVILAAALPTLLDNAGRKDPLLSEAGAALHAAAWITLILLPAAGLLLLALVPEPRRVASRMRAGWRDGWSLLTVNRPFRRLLLSYLFNGVANGLPATLFLLFVTNVLVLPEHVGLFLLAYFGIAIIGMPLWLRLARRYGKHRTWCAAMLYNCATFAMVPLLGEGDFIGYMAVCLTTGLAFGADLVLPPSMQADVVDVDTAGGGGQRTGLYFALWGMATKLAQALAVGIAFPLLELAGFSAFSANTPAALAGLTALYCGAPVVFKLIAVALVWNFPLTASTQATLRHQIES